jgi:hypothetical protein
MVAVHGTTWAAFVQDAPDREVRGRVPFAPAWSYPITVRQSP